MKGPYQRLKYDLRRLWECPACNRRERTPGSITFRHCSCRLKQLDGKFVVMTLVADGVQRLVPAIAAPQQPHAPAPQELSGEDREAPAAFVASDTPIPPADAGQ